MEKYIVCGKNKIPTDREFKIEEGFITKNLTPIKCVEIENVGNEILYHFVTNKELFHEDTAFDELEDPAISEMVKKINEIYVKENREDSKMEMFKPMYEYIPKFLWDDLMFMGKHEDKIYLYKHDMTRSYINIDNEGNFYAYIGADVNAYQKIDRKTAFIDLDIPFEYYIEKIADRKYDGHFTIMKFTTNWRFCFGTASGRKDISQMAEGKTMEEAILNGIINNINVYDFE